MNARSYLVDTILNGYPFPKVSIRQIIDLKTKKVVREIIDGQQRIMAINDFIHDKFTISKVSDNYAGKKYSDLDEESQGILLGYEVSVDMVIAATEDQVLEIFRRMNSYMLPLNDAEKRHAEYQGEFKWFVKNLLEKYTPYYKAAKILSPTLITRMADADLTTELLQLILKGVEDRNPTSLNLLYRDFDKKFEQKSEVESKFVDIMSFIKDSLSITSDSRLLNSALFYSLFGALLLNKYGLPAKEGDTELDNLPTTNKFCVDINIANQNIIELLTAYKNKDEAETGEDDGSDDKYHYYKEFVAASTATTHRIKQRKIRIKWFYLALNDTM